MSQFSALLKSHISSRNITFKQLARLSGIERTRIHHMVSGKRSPSDEDMVGRLAEALLMTPEEQDALIESYRVAAVGEEIYARRQAVQRMLFGISPPGRFECGAAALPVPANGAALPQVIEGTARLQALLKRLIDRESAAANGRIDLLAQPDNEFFLGLLQSASMDSNLQIRQIICLDNGRSAEENNVHTLSRLISTLLGCSNYEARYYYSALSSSTSRIIPFPSLLLTGSCAVQFKSDYSAAIVSTGEAFGMLSRHFTDCLKNSLPLVNRVVGLPAILNMWSSIWTNINRQEKTVVWSVLPDLCCSAFLSAEILKKYLPAPMARDEDTVSLIRCHSQKALDGIRGFPLTVFMTKSGVMRFLKTGRTAEIPYEIYSPFSPADRAGLLSEYITVAEESEQLDILLYDPKHLPFPPHLSLTADEGGNGFFLASNLPETGYNAVSIQAPTITPAVTDYLESLKAHPAVMPKKEAVAWLKRTLEEYLARH